MNSPEFMSGTNRFVIKLDDNSKIIITRELVNDQINYMVNITSNIDYALTDFAKECGYLIMLYDLNIDNKMVTLEGTVVENIAIREEYHIVNGNEFGKFTVSYIPYPEEATRVVPITLCFEEIKEMTGDIEMIQDMVDKNLLSARQADLINYGIVIKPQLKVVSRNKKQNNEEDTEFENVPSLLTVINGRSKVKKK